MNVTMYWTKRKVLWMPDGGRLGYFINSVWKFQTVLGGQRAIQKGDTLWFVTCRRKTVELVSRLRITKCVSEKEMLQLYPNAYTDRDHEYGGQLIRVLGPRQPVLRDEGIDLRPLFHLFGGDDPANPGGNMWWTWTRAIGTRLNEDLTQLWDQHLSTKGSNTL